MNWMEVCLLVIGIGAFVLSFILPDKKGNGGVEVDSETINALIEKKMKDARAQVDEIVDESTQYAIEKMERASERISNEKIMAINDYSDTVLADVNKSHQEVMFLYDMLNDKQKNIKETVKEVQKESKEIEEKTRQAKEVVNKAKTEAEKAFVEMPALMPSIKDKKNKIEVFSFADQAPKFEKISTGASNGFKPLENVTQAVVLEETVSNITAKDEPKVEPAVVNNKENNNDKILRLSRMGMSSVDIAKELGLGVGEVKLVINLFKGAV